MTPTPQEQQLQLLYRQLVRLFNKACADYSLIADNDHILVGLSGGKDSLALVELLGERQKIFVPRFRVSAAHIIVENIGYQSDADYLRLFCEQHGVPFHLITTRYEQQPESRLQHNHCFLCSWYRRKALFDLAQQLGCNKIALGHHKDDIIQTMLMNIIYQGSFSTIPPALQMQKFKMQLIRPLCLIREEQLQQLALLRQYKQVPKLCPYEKESSRAQVKQLVGQLAQLNPHFYDSAWAAMENIKPDYLPQKKR